MATLIFGMRHATQSVKGAPIFVASELVGSPTVLDTSINNVEDFDQYKLILQAVDSIDTTCHVKYGAVDIPYLVPASGRIELYFRSNNTMLLAAYMNTGEGSKVAASLEIDTINVVL